LNNLNSKTIAGDISQAAPNSNAAGAKIVAKKPKTSASRAKESISKLSEKKGVKKDTVKK